MYKRQLLGYAGACAFRYAKQRELMYYGWATTVDAASTDYAPVSYTHLDVYKRQGKDCRERDNDGRPADDRCECERWAARTGWSGRHTGDLVTERGSVGTVVSR